MSRQALTVSSKELSPLPSDIEKAGRKVQGSLPLVSVVLPAYNAENDLQKSIDSVLTQTYPNIELVIVNDGSTDRTKAICDLYEKKDARVHAVHQKNSGVSAARNNGISHAAGSLICFLDADDRLSPDIIRTVVENFSEGCLNIWGATEFFSNGTTRHEAIDARGMTKEELIANAICGLPNRSYTLGRYFRAVWGKLFEKDIIDKYSITFPQDLYMGEDAIFLIKYLTHISDVHISAQDGYYYNRTHHGSATTTYHDDLYEQCEIQYKHITEVIAANSLDKSEPIADSLINFRWWTVTVLMKNALKGIASKKLPVFRLTKQSIRWMEEYKSEMETPAANLSSVRKSYRNLYRHRKKINSIALLRYYFLPQAVTKLYRKTKQRLIL